MDVPKTRAAMVVTACAGGLLWALARSFQRVEVHGPSMMPTLAPGDRLLVRRVRAARPRLRRGELVVVADPRDRRRPVVKRVAALPGQTAVVGGAVVEAGPGSLIVLGDHPEASTDSRTYGPVALAMVQGRVCYRYAPPERAGRLRW